MDPRYELVIHEGGATTIRTRTALVHSELVYIAYRITTYFRYCPQVYK